MGCRKLTYREELATLKVVSNNLTITSKSSVWKNCYRYVGKEKDEESGMYYYGARYYAPWLCRFISCDPLKADYAHLTPYQNANNKVINEVDIDGMQGSGEGTSQESSSSGGGGGTDNGKTEHAGGEITGTNYTVKQGDTLYSIGKRTGTSTDDLRSANGIEGSDISPGQELKINKSESSSLQFDTSEFDGLNNSSTDNAATVINTLDVNKYTGKKADGNVVSFLKSMDKLKSSATGSGPAQWEADLGLAGGGAGNGMMEGEQGLKTFSKGLDNTGTLLLATPLAPASPFLKGASATIDTGLDIKNKSAGEAGFNFGIRVFSVFLGGVSKKLVNKGLDAVPESVKKEAVKGVIDMGVNIGLDNVQNKIVNPPKTTK